MIARPDDIDGWIYYANLLERKGHDKAAAATYRDAIKLLQTHREAWRELGNVLTKLGDFAGAYEVFRFADYQITSCDVSSSF